MIFDCDIKLSEETFKKFEIWYRENNSEFTGTIRRAAESLWIADIIDSDQNLRKYRFANRE
jgi:hypothetical protein